MDNNDIIDTQAAGVPDGGTQAAPAAGPARRSGFPEWYDYIAIALLFIASGAVNLIVSALCGVIEDNLNPPLDVPDPDPDMLIVNSSAFSNMMGYVAGMIFLVAMVLVYRHFRGGRGRIVRFSPRGFDPLLLLEGFVVLIAVSIVLSPLVELLPGKPDYSRMVGRDGWALLSTVVFAPLFEEFLFRGVILESTWRRYGAVAAWLVSSLCFGAVHMMLSSMVAAASIGLILGYLYIRSRSLFGGIMLHALNNELAMILLIIGFEDFSLAAILPANVYRVVYAVSAVIVVWWLVHAWRNVRAAGRMEQRSSAA